jgi:hypothetical protein
MRFMIKEKGGVNAAVFVEFLKRLITGAKRGGSPARAVLCGAPEG